MSPPSPADVLADEALINVLVRSRELGFLGPGPVDAHVRHALAYLPFVASMTDAVDLGSGGGIPGLVLARHGDRLCRWRLLDANRRRCAFLRTSVEDLDLGGRVEVLEGRAEDLGKRPDLRGRAGLVVVRSFGPPPTVAECAAPLLAIGGRLVVSEPPATEVGERWPIEGLARVGLGPADTVPGPVRMATMVQVERCPDRFPRRVGVPAKRPLF